ncbi:MAG: DUF1016 domain-containing protein, partial [Desulfobacula sp.]|nr:DUF1016 domain-containing protein [Desulfobacula sp.]
MAERKNIYILLVVLLLCFHTRLDAGTDTSIAFSEKKPAAAYYIATFFPQSSPFSHSKIKSRLPRKKIKQQINKYNRQNYKIFIENSNAIFAAIRDSEAGSGNYHNVLVLWQLGQAVALEERRHYKNKEFLKYLIKNLSSDLRMKESRLKNILKFYKEYELAAEISPQLKFIHYEILTNIKDKKARKFYQGLAVSESLRPEELTTRINQK